jgi:hypothetical protein
MNPNAIVIMWLLSLLMAGAIATGPLQIGVVAALAVIYTVIAILT